MGGGLKSTYRSWRPSCDYMQVAQEAVTMVGVQPVPLELQGQGKISTNGIGLPTADAHP